MAIADFNFEITDDERRDLQDITRHAGYKVLQKIMDSYAGAVREGAIGLSLSDPLNNASQVSNAWAYAKMARLCAANLFEGVKFELDVLRMRENKPDPEALAKMRHQRFVLEAIPTQEV